MWCHHQRIGERAGNAVLGEIVMPFSCGPISSPTPPTIETKQIYSTSQLHVLSALALFMALGEEEHQQSQIEAQRRP